jgi:hypothetical protein
MNDEQWRQIERLSLKDVRSNKPVGTE